MLLKPGWHEKKKMVECPFTKKEYGLDNPKKDAAQNDTVSNWMYLCVSINVKRLHFQ